MSKRLIPRCPTCKALFYFELDYEFLADGAENVETLRRLSAREAADLT